MITLEAAGISFWKSSRKAAKSVREGREEKGEGDFHPPLLLYL
jgi:hypothetical protein